MNRLKQLILVCFGLICLANINSNAQDYTNNTAKYLTWTALQLVPSPVFLQDSDGKNAGLKFGLRWQVIPINISFRANKYVSPAQFFMINPTRKFTGSIELFVQPELAISQFNYSGLNRFGVAAGSRITFPIKGDGEIFSGSIGGKYNFRKDDLDNTKGYYGLEAGFYVLYGIVGLQFNYNFTDKTKYNFGIYFKYF